MNNSNYHILIDPPSTAVLAMSKNLAAIIILQECTTDTIYAPAVQKPNYTFSIFHQEPFFLARADASEYPRWAWDFNTRTFSPIKNLQPDNPIFARSKLVNAKAQAIETLLGYVSYARNPLLTGLMLQETVYHDKKVQAEAFKKSGYDETSISNIPYVVQYADIAQISLRQAADDILFKSKLDTNILLKTEALRITYLRKIKDASEPAEVTKILEGLRRDSYRWKEIVS